MSQRESMIEALLSRSEADFAKLGQHYKDSLYEKSVSYELKINIKVLCENLRSVLDYLAHDIREKYCPEEDPKDKFYFPITDNYTSFEKIMSRSYPALDSKHQNIWKYLESIQPYNGNNWLSNFNRLNNENKHGSLVEQTRKEVRQTKATGNGGTVSWNPDRVKFGSGGTVRIHNVPIDVNTQEPIPDPSIKVEHIIWIDFQFEDINVSALKLLKESLDGIRAISTETQKYL